MSVFPSWLISNKEKNGIYTYYITISAVDCNLFSRFFRFMRYAALQYSLSASRNYKLVKNISLRCVLNFIYTEVSLRGLPPVISAMLASKEKHHLHGEVSTSFCLHYKKKKKKRSIYQTHVALISGLFPLLHL